jgi:hypothetical protein
MAMVTEQTWGKMCAQDQKQEVRLNTMDLHKCGGAFNVYW